MDTKFQNWLKEARWIWWSRLAGTGYVYDLRITSPKGTTMVRRGPYRLAYQSPGAFNLYWLLTKPPGFDAKALAIHTVQYAPLIPTLTKFAAQIHEGYPIDEWAVVLKPQAFIDMLTRNPGKLQPPSQWASLKEFADALQKAVAPPR